MYGGLYLEVQLHQKLAQSFNAGQYCEKQPRMLHPSRLDKALPPY